MNRLSPLIVRRSGPFGAVLHPINKDTAPQSEWLDDLKLFVTGWAGGLVFFGTFFS